MTNLINNMHYKILGKAGLKVSELGFGALQFARIPEKDAIGLVGEAYSLGINIFDTAHSYPNSEAILGKALKGIRDDVIIVTKSISRDKKQFIFEFETSLRRLNTDYIDIFLFHGVSKVEEFEKLNSNGVIEALIREKQKGKLNFIGFSCHYPEVIEHFYEINEFSIILIPVNIVSTEFTQDQIYKKAIDNNIGILGMKPLGGGRIREIELCFKYIKQFDRIIPIVGMENVNELIQNVNYMNSKSILSSKDRKKIIEIRKELGTKFCRGCAYCLPCSQEINIPDINFLKIYYKQFSEDSFITPERTEKVNKVNECIECGECEERCPFDLKIIDTLKENRDFYFEKLNYIGNKS